VDEALPVLVIATAGGGRAKMLSARAQPRARRAAGKLVDLCCAGAAAEAAAAAGPGAALLEVARVPDALQPAANVAPLQRPACHLARARGLGVDRPRDLAKSVTAADG
jgi:glucosamine--fructose-6-phosphate aminotransferase (isomerizing)